VTPKQAEVLAFVTRFIVERGISPTYREIGGALGGITATSVLEHVAALLRNGDLVAIAPPGHARRLGLPDSPLYERRARSAAASLAANGYGLAIVLERPPGTDLLAWSVGTVDPERGVFWRDATGLASIEAAAAAAYGLAHDDTPDL
jgi:hypothetical protein